MQWRTSDPWLGRGCMLVNRGRHLLRLISDCCLCSAVPRRLLYLCSTCSGIYQGTLTMR
jgi:hypothetical protein